MKTAATFVPFILSAYGEEKPGIEMEFAQMLRETYDTIPFVMFEDGTHKGGGYYTKHNTQTTARARYAAELLRRNAIPEAHVVDIEEFLAGDIAYAESEVERFNAEQVALLAEAEPEVDSDHYIGHRSHGACVGKLDLAGFLEAQRFTVATIRHLHPTW